MSQPTRGPSASVAVGAAALMFCFTTTAALAQKGDDGGPKPKIDCSKKENQKKAACKNKRGELSDNELYYAGYWLARKGDYSLAIQYLSQARRADDPRIATYLGYSYRKLGRVDRAMSFYRQALTSDPNYLVARAYMGEAFLEQGDRTAAIAELGEIKARGGDGSAEFKELAAAIARHDQQRS